MLNLLSCEGEICCKSEDGGYLAQIEYLPRAALCGQHNIDKVLVLIFWDAECEIIV